MATLTEKRCKPCEKGTAPLTETEIQPFLRELDEEWEVVRNHHLERTFKFKNFREALEFTNKVGEIAERENHHPDICLSWGKVTVTLWTHAIDGLSENDFILAAKCDKI